MTRVIVVLKPRVLTTLLIIVRIQISKSIRKDNEEERDIRWKKRIKRASTQMETLHQHKNPSLVIPTSLLQALHSRHRFPTISDVITLHACMRQFALCG